MNDAQNLNQSLMKRQRFDRLLSILDRYQPISRTDLSTLSGMSPASITRIVSALIGQKLVGEVSMTDNTGRGRRAINLHTLADGAYTLGFHIAADRLYTCLLDFDHRVRAKRVIQIDTLNLRPEELSALARQLAFEILPPDTSRVRAAGISVSGQIDRKTQQVICSKVFHWDNVDLLSPFRRLLNMPIYIENDVKACLTWEGLHRGYFENHQDVAYLYIGKTGVGFANSIGGRLVRGANNAAGEIEDVPMTMNERLGEHLMESGLISRARLISPSVKSMSDILEAYRMQLSWARTLLQDFSDHLNLLLQLVFALLDPHEIILGGGIPDVLRSCPEMVGDPRCTFGDDFDSGCACGIAFIAMWQSVLDLLDDLPEAP